MSNLRVVVDQIVAPDPGEVGRYTSELTRELIASAPDGIAVEGIVSASSQSHYAAIEQELPGLARLHKSAFDRRALQGLLRRGLGGLGGGMVHAPDLLAPLSGHARQNSPGEQTVVTVHDTLAWTHPESLPRGEAAWRKSMVRRAEKHADAVVVPNHAVAADLDDVAALGDRIRVITGGASTALVLPQDADRRAERLGLPERYLLAWGTGSARRALLPLLRGMTRTDGPDVPIVILGSSEVQEAAAEAGLDPARVLQISPTGREDRATVLHRAAVLVHPGPAEGFGLPVIDAMQAGVPVVHADDAALEELTADAALVVSRSDVAGYTASLAQHIAALLEDDQTRERMRIAGRDRAGLFSWRDAAEKVWQLHADL